MNWKRSRTWKWAKSFETAAREHLSKRLLEFGLAKQDEDKKWTITPLGRELIRRQED